MCLSHRLGRGFLAGTSQSVEHLDEQDLRSTIARPRFEPDAFARNQPLLLGFADIAKESRCSMAQLALAWLLSVENETLIPILGTRSIEHMRENAASAALTLSAETLERIDALINESTVTGDRYTADRMLEADSERDVRARSIR